MNAKNKILLALCLAAIVSMVWLYPAMLPCAMAKCPDKPIHVINPSSPGSSGDILSRIAIDILQKEKIIEVPILVEYKPGGGLSIGYDYVAGKRGDPYIITPVVTQFMTLPILGVTKSTLKDFTILCELASDPFIPQVRKDYEYQTLKELMDGALKNPGKIRWGGIGQGGGDRIIMMRVAKKTGAQFNYVPFKGPAEIVMALLGKHIDVSSNQLNESYAQISSGEFKCLAIASSARSEFLPDVPTLAELGYDIEQGAYRGFAAPADIPEEARSFLEDAFKKLNDHPRWKREFIEKFQIQQEYRNGASFRKLIENQIVPEFRNTYKDIGLLK